MALRNKCSICWLHFRNSRQLYHHMKSHYGQQRTPEQPSCNPRNPKKVFTCDICAQNFSSQRELYHHMKIHFTTGPRQVKRPLPIDHSTPSQEKPHKLARVQEQIGGARVSRKKRPRPPSSLNDDKPRKKTHFEPGYAEPGPSNRNGPGNRGRNVQLRIDAHNGRLRSPTADEIAADSQEPHNNLEDDDLHLEKVSSRRIKSLNADETTYRLHIPPGIRNMLMSQVLRQIYNMFDEALKELKKDMGPHDRIRVLLTHPVLHAPVHIKATSPDELTAELILSTIEKVLQSEEKLPLDQDLRVIISTLRPNAGGTGVKHYTNYEEARYKKKSIVSIENPDDNLCLERAICVCMANLNGRLNKKKWKKIIRKSRPAFQYQEALKLRTAVGIAVARKTTVKDIAIYEQYLNVQIVVLSVTHLKRVIYRGSQRRVQKLFLVQHTNGHYDAVISVSGFLGTRNFCENCLVPFHHKKDHRCETHCTVCESDNCLDTGSNVFCSDCNRTCKSQGCYDRHMSSTSNSGNELKLSKCQKYWKCPDCNVLLIRQKRSPELHECGEYVCKCCHTYVLGQHLCYQRAEPATAPNKRYVFLDFECTQDSKVSCPKNYAPPPRCSDKCDPPCEKCKLCQNCLDVNCGQATQHIPNYCICITVCERCIDSNEPLTKHSKCDLCGDRCETCNMRDKEGNYLKPPCDQCGYKERRFRADNVTHLVGSFLFSKKRKDYTMVAHNMSGYDSFFLISYLLQNGVKPDSVIYQGSHVTYVHIKQGLDIRIIDSLKFLPMKLAKLSDAFGLSHEVQKGWFPHFMNTKANSGYKGPYPHPKYYGAENMAPSERQKLEEWLTSKAANNEIFDLEQGLELYCRMDVHLLLKACLKYRKLVLDATTSNVNGKIRPGIDPFNHVTTAGVSHAIFRSKMLPESWKLLISGKGANDKKIWVNGIMRDGVMMVETAPDHWEPEDKVKVFQKKFISTPIGMIPIGGYAGTDHYSNISIAWLKWVQHHKRTRDNRPEYTIQHGHSVQGEAHIPRQGRAFRERSYYKVDGFSAADRCCYEFYGCRCDIVLIKYSMLSFMYICFSFSLYLCSLSTFLFTVFCFLGRYHGHDCIVKGAQRTVPYLRKNGRSADQLYQATLKREQCLKDLGYEVVSIWECQFKKQMEENEEIKAFVNNVSVEKRLDPRDAFFGNFYLYIYIYILYTIGKKVEINNITLKPARRGPIGAK